MHSCPPGRGGRSPPRVPSARRPAAGCGGCALHGPRGTPHRTAGLQGRAHASTPAQGRRNAQQKAALRPRWPATPSHGTMCTRGTMCMHGTHAHAHMLAWPSSSVAIYGPPQPLDPTLTGMLTAITPTRTPCLDLWYHWISNRTRNRYMWSK